MVCPVREKNCGFCLVGPFSWLVGSCSWQTVWVRKDLGHFPYKSAHGQRLIKGAFINSDRGGHQIRHTNA